MYEQYFLWGGYPMMASFCGLFLSFYSPVFVGKKRNRKQGDTLEQSNYTFKGLHVCNRRYYY